MDKTLLKGVQDNPDSFHNRALSSDVLHDLKTVNEKVTDEDVRKFMSNIKKPYHALEHCNVSNCTPRD